MIALRLAWRQLAGHWRGGELRLMCLALVLAVAATTAVGLFTDRVQHALQRQGSLLLGADLVVMGDHPLAERYGAEAARRQLRATQTLEFPSMVMHGEQGQLAEIKAISAGFPLRGGLQIADAQDGAAMETAAVPPPGSVWLEPRLAMLLDARVGDTLELGELRVTVAALLVQEASRGGDLFNFAPRLMMNQADLDATGLVQYGSRVRYQYLLAGPGTAVDAYALWAKAQLEQGEQLQTVADARPEIRSALDKARQFLGLSAMVGVLLAVVAMALASLAYVRRSLDDYALMRCLGASKRLIARMLLWQTLLLALLGSLLGCALGYAAQAGLGALAGRLFLDRLPSPGWQPLLAGLALGLCVVAAVLGPPLARLVRVPPLRILRRAVGDDDGRGWLRALPALAVVIAMLYWQAGSLALGSAVTLGLLLLLLLGVLLGLAGRVLLRRLPPGRAGAWRLGLAGLRRRPLMALAQVFGFGLGLMALVVLTLVRGDLMHNWQAALPPDAPNRFIINIQPQQVAPLQAFLDEAGVAAVTIHPMIRGRLVEINGVPLDTSRYADTRARRLAEREFNLSWAAALPSDNRVVQGRWWTPAQSGEPQLSLEQGLAETLGIRLHDRLSYDIAGSRLDVTVTSLRKVEWDSMRVNFFALTPPGLLEGYSASHITSFHLPQGREQILNTLLRKFSNLSIIDVAALMAQVRGIMDKMAHAIGYVFAFSWLAGLVVLYAALQATRTERRQEVALLRTLGASRRQVLVAGLSEFAAIGLLAGLMAAVAANALAWYVSLRILDIPYHFNPLLALITLLAAVLLIPLAAWPGVRALLRQAPLRFIRDAPQ